VDVRNSQFLFLGFAAAWLIVIVYVVILTMRESKLRRELDRVRKMVEDGGKRAEAGGNNQM
jgi:CcmD family protein